MLHTDPAQNVVIVQRAYNFAETILDLSISKFFLKHITISFIKKMYFELYDCYILFTYIYDILFYFF